ncbi:MAG: DNA repair protein RecN [Proteobacteria bacterium]|nr:MAG: DNA repair protein RecN [Pseudomonadota bacterium]PIE67175.1 MAG: DNA repair protein RecN [Deltaproteobacteria bacterium]
MAEIIPDCCNAEPKASPSDGHDFSVFLQTVAPYGKDSMLKELLIKNFAIIDDLNIRFEQGLTVLSGETGAGKSVIVRAVNLLLGSRANARVVRDGFDSAELSAFFEVPKGSAAAAVMADNGYVPDDGLLVRRIITRNDRHRIYINDRMATMQMLAAIASDLASISGQHAHQGLLKEESHMAILDRFGNLGQQVETMQAFYQRIQPMVQDLKDLYEKKANREKEMELLLFQAQEIDDADIQPNEDVSLEKERLRLKNTEFLYRTVAVAIDALHGSDGSILERLGEIRKSLEKAADLDDRLTEGVQGLADHLYGLEDLTELLRSYLGVMDTSAERIASVDQRLDLVNRLKRKYGGSLEKLFASKARIQAELGAIENMDDAIQQLEARLEADFSKAAELARKLSDKRKRIAARFSKCVETELADLKMAGTRFSVHLSLLPGDALADKWLCVDGSRLTPTGIDQAVFMIAPNVGESEKPLASIASGGELSRVVLALKAILAETDAVGTVIFDEVDAGIGGAVADTVGKKLESLSRKHQLICITHLPQIARFADHHYHIKKQVSGGRTTTTINPMDAEARIREIARMLGGETITPTAMEHARSLLAT